MGLHQNNENKQSDDMFVEGDYSYLVVNNECRLLDGRRTPGYIECIDLDSAMFTWRITDYEDQGNCWFIPFSEVFRYQFKIESVTLSDDDAMDFEKADQSYVGQLEIIASEENRLNSEMQIEVQKKAALEWLSFNKNSGVFEEVKLGANSHVEKIAALFQEYMKSNELDEMERLTAEDVVLNPNSGEWIKGMIITLAEMGLLNCYVPKIRTKDIFTGLGTKENRRNYLLHRLAFVRAMFEELSKEDVILYRGMASEGKWMNKKRSLLNMTFSKEVAEAFASFDLEMYKTSYIMRTEISVKDLLMTYLETAQMNERYQEQEAVVLAKNEMWL